MDTINTTLLNELFKHYNFNISNYIGKKPINKGHINTTYILYFDYGNKVKRYLLQQINTNVFTNCDNLMKNIYNVTEHVKKKLKNKKNKFLRLYKTKNNKNYVKLSNNSCFRVYHYIENCINYDKTSSLDIFYEVGKTIGQFHTFLNDFDVNKLFITINDFHNCKKRYDFFINVLNNTNKSKIKTCEKEINYFISNKYISSLIQDLIDSKKMPIRVTHNDTKLNNFMFEYNTNKGQCIVDLDTTMPGCICFDYGDFIRSGCNKANEDEIDINKVKFNIEGCKAFTDGYLKKMKNKLSEIEINNLFNGAIVITYECGLRFLTDYLLNNIYFKVDYETHNLIRCKTQIELCKQLILNSKTMNEYIKEK